MPGKNIPCPLRDNILVGECAFLVDRLSGIFPLSFCYHSSFIWLLCIPSWHKICTTFILIFIIPSKF